MDVICPKGHMSTDPDYCSECGAKITSIEKGLQASTPGTSPIATGDDVCPDCGTKRSNTTALFCEVCRYNFTTHQSWSPPPIAVNLPPPMPDTGAVPPESASTAPPGVTPPSEFVGWNAIVSVDAGLYTEPDPNIPLPTEPERTYPVDLADNLIGRRSDRRDIHPEINVNDPGVSHRHAKLLREQGGTLTLLDIGSTNGTLLNGTNVPPGVRTPISDGDQITIGSWTRIVIQGRRS